MQAVGTSVSLTARINEHDDICRVVRLYMDGAAKWRYKQARGSVLTGRPNVRGFHGHSL
jgi:hypothetical protein